MRNYIIAGLMASSLVPVAAQAQRFDRSERAELRGDRRDIREERRDLDRAYRYGDRRDIRDERGDLRDARREYRRDYREAAHDWGRNDWRGWRDGNRDLYRGGNWHSEYRYRSFSPGIRLGVGYYSPLYYINDYGRYRLPRPGYNQRWIRNYNDVLLVDVRSGYVIDVIRNFYW